MEQKNTGKLSWSAGLLFLIVFFISIKLSILITFLVLLIFLFYLRKIDKEKNKKNIENQNKEEDKINTENNNGKEVGIVLILGIVLFIFFGLGGLGISYHIGFITFSIDRLIALWSLLGIVCIFMADKKNKNPNSAFFYGFFFGPLALIYYLVCGSGMTEKEKEIHEWELEKKYKDMLKEKDKN